MAFWRRADPGTFDPATGLAQRAPDPQALPALPVPATVERRDPQVATATTTWQPVGAPMLPEWDAEQAVRFAYIANTYVWACVTKIATAIAGCPLRAGRNPEARDDFDLAAPLAQLLGPPPGGPNPNLSGRKLIAWTVAQRLVTGRWSWEIERATNSDRGKVIGLWPLAAHLLNPIPSAGGRDYWSGFEWNPRNPGARRRLEPWQVLYDWQPSQLDFRQPESVLQAARLDVSVAVMQDRYDVAFLRNDARPAAVIVHAAFAERHERDAWRAQFLGDHRGVDNAGRPIFAEAEPSAAGLDAALAIKTLGLSQKDAEFIARYESKIRAICVALGTPLSILGDSSKRTFSNAGQEYTNWWEGTLLPLQEDLVDAINLKLAPQVGREVSWFDTGHVKALQPKSLFVDLGASVASLRNGPTGPVVTLNEARAELGLPGVPGGDVLETMQSAAPAPVSAEPDADEPEPDEATVATDDHEDEADEADANEQPTASRAPALDVWEVRSQVLVETLPDGSLRIRPAEPVTV